MNENATHHNTPGPRALPPTLRVVAFADPLVEDHGHQPRSPYVETCWLPVLGPSATFAFRRLGTLAQAAPDGVDLDTAELAASLGLGASTARHSTVARTLGRLVDFGAAQWTDSGELAVRSALANLPERLARRLPPSAKAFHRHTLEAQRPGLLDELQTRSAERQATRHPATGRNELAIQPARGAELSGRSR